MFWIPNQAARTPGPCATQAESPHKKYQPSLAFQKLSLRNPHTHRDTLS